MAFKFIIPPPTTSTTQLSLQQTMRPSVQLTIRPSIRPLSPVRLPTPPTIRPTSPVRTTLPLIQPSSPVRAVSPPRVSPPRIIPPSVVSSLGSPVEIYQPPKTIAEAQARGLKLRDPTYQNNLEGNIRSFHRYVNFSLARDLTLNDFTRMVSPINNPADYYSSEISLDNQFLNISLGATADNFLRLSLPDVHSYIPPGESIPTRKRENWIVPVENHQVFISDLVNAIIVYSRGIPAEYGDWPWDDNIKLQRFVYNSRLNEYRSELGLDI